MLTVDEAARRAGRNPETVRRWIREGKLRAVKVGNRHLVEEADLEAATERPRSVGVPDAWRTLPSGRPAPDWVEALHEMREGR